MNSLWRTFGLLTYLLISTISLAVADIEPIRIGWIGPLTGNSAVVGIDALAAIELEFDRVNSSGGIAGRKLKLIVEDDAYLTNRALTAYEKLVQIDKVQFIFMSTYGAVFASAKNAVRDDVVVMDTLDCNDDIAALPHNTLCLATNTESIAEGFSSDIVARSYRTVLMLVEESDGWMQLIAKRTRQTLEQQGIAVLEETSLPTASDYKANLLRAKGRKVDAVILLGNDQMGLAVRQMQELGINAQLYGVGSILSPGFQRLAGKSIEGALVSSWQAPRGTRFQSFLKAFSVKTGRAPVLELAAVPANDAARWLVQCLPQSISKGEVDSRKLRHCFLSHSGFEGLVGRIKFDADGAVRTIKEKLYRWHRGELKEL